MNISSPYIVDEQPGYLAAYKPPGLHSAPLKGKSSPTLLDWCAASFPEVLLVEGRQPWEGGLVHRLDYETGGLLLLARSRSALEALLAQQAAGGLVKDYEALAAALPVPQALPGFPARPSYEGDFPPLIESAFRPYGPGRKVVRPVIAAAPLVPPKKGSALDRAMPYRTEITGSSISGNYRSFSLRLRRGFRHQIRGHLAWIGYPLLNDALYGGPEAELSNGKTLALTAQGLSFLDPLTGESRSYTLPPLTVYPGKSQDNSNVNVQ